MSCSCTHRARALVLLEAEEGVRLVEVLLGEAALADLLRGELAAQLLDEQQHLVVRAPGEENLAGRELVERAADAPHVERAVVRLPKDCSRASVLVSQDTHTAALLTDLGRAVEAADEVRRDLHLARV